MTRYLVGRAFCCAALLACAIIGAASTTAGATAVTAADAPSLSGAALYNTANAYARADKPGLAVLYYERARLLDPVNPDIEANLRVVRARASLPQVAPRWYEPLARMASPTLLAWVGVSGLVLAGLSLLASHLYPARRRASLFAAIVGVVGIAAPLPQASILWPLLHAGVVIIPGAEARVSPVSIGDPAFTLPAGDEVHIASTHQGYVLIRTRAGRSGWLTADSVAPIVP